MSLLENFINAFQVIILNKLRSGLSMLGIIIGVASVIILVSVGQGAQKSIVSRVQSLGSNLLTITPGADRNSDVRIASFGGNNSTQVLKLEHSDLIKEKVSGLNGISPEVTTRKQVIAGKNNTSLSVNGVIPDYEIVRNFKVAYGQFITEENVKNNDKVAVLGTTAVTNLFENEDPIGKNVIIGDRIFTVVGVMEQKGTQGSSNTDNVIFVPISTAQKTLIGNEYVNTIAISVTDADKMDETKNEIDGLLMQKLGIADESSKNFTVANQADAISAVSDITGILTMFLGGIAAISLIVGGIGVMNIMLVSVTERTHEIGIRKAIGATKGDILIQFLAESVVLSILGGTIGILISAGVIYIIQKFNLLEVSVSNGSVLMAFCFSAGIGIFFGILPAYKAAKLKPIDALRFE